MYSYWDTEEMMKQFSGFKRFKSESYFLDKILKSGMSVLDIGCAQGNSYKDLKERYGEIEYCGIDISEKMIEQAKKSYPDAKFFKMNALELQMTKEFDLVTATGVFQHELEYRELFDRMVDNSNKYILFDVKLAHIKICNPDIAYAKIGNEKITFNILDMKGLIDMCLSRPDLNGNIQIYGYYTGVNPLVVLPKSIDNICSAHVLLEKGQRESVKLELNLPEDFIKNSFIVG